MCVTLCKFSVFLFHGVNANATPPHIVNAITIGDVSEFLLRRCSTYPSQACSCRSTKQKFRTMSEQTTQENKFVLRADLRDHLDQVRSIANYPIADGALLTASLDRTVKIWMYKDQSANTEMDTSPDESVDKNELLRQKSQYEATLTLIGHDNTVLDVTYWQPNEQNNMIGNIVSAGHDKSIIIWKIDGTMQDRYIGAHGGPVSAITVDNTTNNIVSGSWDKTAKVWSAGTCISELKGHEGNVLCVLAASNGDIITGSGDGSIRIWRNGKEFKTIKGAHSGIVTLVLFLNISKHL
jgi:WD40 repeat protein